jgi:hypothetical protein
VPLFLHLWWGLFLGAHLLIVASNQLGKGEEPSLSMLRGSAALAGAGSMVRIAAAALAIYLIDRLSDRQARRWADCAPLSRRRGRRASPQDREAPRADRDPGAEAGRHRTAAEAGRAQEARKR